MTHTLHRQGTEESLSHDYCVLAISAFGYNDEGSGNEIAKVKKIMQKHNPTNFGDIKRGNMYSESLEYINQETEDRTVAHAVYTDIDDLKNVLNDLTEADTGLSIVVSGLFDHVGKCCKENGLKSHTVNYSLGIHGQKSLLPDSSILEISTMCGHGMISANLIRRMVKKIEAGTIKPIDGAKELAKQCICGLLNVDRAEKLLCKLANKE